MKIKIHFEDQGFSVDAECILHGGSIVVLNSEYKASGNTIADAVSLFRCQVLGREL